METTRPGLCPLRHLSRGGMFEALGPRGGLMRQREGGRARLAGLSGRTHQHPTPSPLSLADDDDTNSYENVLICKPRRMDSGKFALGSGLPLPGFTMTRPCVPGEAPSVLDLLPPLRSAKCMKDAGCPSRGGHSTSRWPEEWPWWLSLPQPLSWCSPCRGRGSEDYQNSGVHPAVASPRESWVCGPEPRHSRMVAFSWLALERGCPSLGHTVPGGGGERGA